AEFEGQLPFAGFVDTLDDYLGSLNPRRLATLEDEQLAELAHVFPSLSSLGADAPSGLQDERYRSHGAVRRLLEVLAAAKPLVLALDDLHGADAAASELLAHLLRRPPRAPVLLALGFRAGQAPPALQLALEDLRGDAVLTQIELGPLKAAEADEMLGSDLGPSARRELHRMSGGNPFYLEELARYGDPLLGESGTPIDPGEAQVPQAVADALARELRGLSEQGRTVAQGAAVAGETFDAELAAEAAQVSEAATLEAIDELLETDLLRRTDAPRRFRFRHPIVHSAVYEAAKPGWRLAAHAKVAAALEARRAPPPARAPPLGASGLPRGEGASARPPE